MYQRRLSLAGQVFLLVGLVVATAVGQDFANDIVDRERQQQQSDRQTPPSGGSTDVTQQNAANRARMMAALVKEMNELIPGDYPENAPQQALLIKLANAILQSDAKTVDATLGQLVEGDPSLPPKGLLLAAANFTVSNAAGGRAMLERAAIENPGHPSISIAFSRLAISQGRTSDALALVEKAIRQMGAAELTPVEQRHYQIESLDVQQIIAKRQNRMEDALALVGQWEQLDPSNPKMMIGRAEVAFEQGDIDTSQQYLRKFRAVVPDSQPTELVLATWFQKKGNAKGTDEWVRKASENYPENPEVQIELGNWAISQEDFDTALEVIANVETKRGQNFATNLMKGRIAFAKGDYSQAEQIFDQLYQLQPSNFDVSNMYALSLAENGDAAKKNLGVQLAERNLRGLPNSQIAQAAFGWALFKSGNVADAKTMFSRVARQQRLPPEIAYYLAVLLVEQGQADQAKQLLQSALQSKGMFLYRVKAREALKQLESEAGLPAPDK